jgi:DNA gyrase subunit A
LDEGDSLVGVNLCTEKDDIMLSTKNGKCVRFPVTKLRVFQSRSSSGVRGIKLDPKNEVIAMSVLKNMDIDILIKEKYLKIPTEKRIELKETLLFNQSLKDKPSDDLLAASPKAIPNIEGAELAPEKIQEMALSEEFILTITENGYGKRSSAYEYRTTNRGGVGITNIITSKRNGNVVASFPIDNSDHVMIITDKGTLIRTDISSVRITGRNTQGVTLIKTKGDTVVSVARIAHSGKEEIDEAETGEVLEGEGGEE